MEITRVKRQTATAIRSHAEGKGRGSIPGGWAEWADLTLGTPQVRWQDKLARMARRAVQYKAGAVDYRYSRPSRRQGSVGGWTGGAPILPALRAPLPRVAVVVDTSGSMSQRDLELALDEIGGILRACGSEVDFVACDAAVHGGIQKVRSAREASHKLVGRGGTDFRPAFEALAKARQRPDMIVFATDGEGQAPAVEPAWTRTIWLLIGQHATLPCSWGTEVHVA